MTLTVAKIKRAVRILAASEKQLAARVAKYGLTLDQYDSMLMSQRNRCAICHRPPAARPLEIDHDHRTGRVRGLLCWYCNKFRVARADVRHAEMYKRISAYLASTFDGRKL